MKKILTIALLSIGAFSLIACGAKVEVPPAHLGKVLTKNGYSPETLSPSKFRLPPCFAYCDKLVLLETADNSFVESMPIFMPVDKLNLTVEVRGTLTIPTDKSIVDPLYKRLTSKATNDRNISIIGATTIYRTYGQQALRGIVRSEITKHTISEILSNREAIGESIHAAITKKLYETNTPIKISRFELDNVQPPQVIVTAQEKAKEREIAVQQAEADANVKLTEAKLALEIAKKDSLVESERAEDIAEQNEIASKSITAEVLAYKKLETAEKIYMALSKSDNVIIVPADSSGFSNLTDDAVLAKMLGQQFGKK